MYAVIMALAGFTSSLFGAAWGLNKSMDQKEEVRKNTEFRIEQETIKKYRLNDESLNIGRIDRR